MDYWLYRLFPLTSKNKKFTFVCSNWVGSEGKIKYIGCSCFMKFDQDEIDMDSLNDKDEGILIKKIKI